MAEHLKTFSGILALVDLVNFTPQARHAGDTNMSRYMDYFHDKCRSIAGKQDYHVIDTQGDGVLLFGTDPEGILEIMLDLFQRDKPEDIMGFKAQLRMVAHFGFFQMKHRQGIPTDLAAAEGIKVFRMEKSAQSWELVVTEALYNGIQPMLTAKGIDAQRMQGGAVLKGFDNKEWNPPFYTLTVKQKKETASNLLLPTLEALEKDVRFIPVFGSIYPPVKMEKNFINLSLVCGDGDCLPPKLALEISETDDLMPEEWDDLADREQWPLHEPFKGKNKLKDRDSIDEKLRRRREIIKDFDVPDFYKYFNEGVILGLPGAGKTTILRNIAFKEFKLNKENSHGQPRLPLLVPCRNMMHYDHWYQKMYEAKPGTPGIDEVLEFMTWVFLFQDLEPGDVDKERYTEFREAVNRVKAAYKEGRVTLLVDALDEAADSKTRERIKDLFVILFKQRKNTRQNRLYLTSRPSEGVHLSDDLKKYGIREFRVMSLTMEQVRAVAKHIMNEDSEIYKSFDTAIWQEELVARMAATPLTALLVTAYFQAYEQFDLRYLMYDLLVKFILLKAWEDIKSGEFPHKNLRLFFKEIKDPAFMKKHDEARLMYHALAELCFELFYDSVDGKVHRSVSEDVLTLHLVDHIKRFRAYNDDQMVEVEATQWRERFHRDHLLLQSGAQKYVFVHSTVMEYLAAFHMVQAAFKDGTQLKEMVNIILEQEAFRELETLAITAGSSLLNGYRVLEVLKDNLTKTGPKAQWIYREAMDCLAEIEWLLHKTYRAVPIKRLLRPVTEMVEGNFHNTDWVYKYIASLILERDKEQLKEHLEIFQRQVRLNLETFLTTYLDFDAFNSGEPETLELRKELLEKLVRRELVDNWLKANLIEPAIDILEPVEPVAMEMEVENVLQLDRPAHHPQHHPYDKNFHHYREQVGTGIELTGFYGSPNLRHSAAVTACAFSKDGKLLVSASHDKTLKLWDTQSGKEIRAFKGHNSYVYSCAFAPDGNAIISASHDKTLKLWDTQSGKEIRAFKGHTQSVRSCAFAPDGNAIISASADQTLKLWDTQSGKEIRAFKGHNSSVYSCAFAPDGNAIISASADQTLKLWDTQSGKEIRAFKGHNRSVYSCAFAPDGNAIISASADQTLKLWDTQSGKEIRAFKGHTHWVQSCAFAPDGKAIISASADQTLKLWETHTGRLLHSIAVPWTPRHVAFHPHIKGQVICANLNGTVTAFDVMKWMK